MKINTIIKTTLASALIATVSACQRKPLVEMPKENIPQEVEYSLKSINKQSQKVLNDTTYKFYGYDTIRIDGRSPIEPAQLKKEFDKRAEAKDKKVEIDRHTTMQPILVGKTRVLKPHTHYTYASEHINHQAVIKSDKIFTTDSTDIFIPVEYYGQINPKTIKNETAR